MLAQLEASLFDLVETLAAATNRTIVWKDAPSHGKEVPSPLLSRGSSRFLRQRALGTLNHRNHRSEFVYILHEPAAETHALRLAQVMVCGRSGRRAAS
jgi:hypothetical protein